LKIANAEWGVTHDLLNVQAPLFAVPELCTVHVRLGAGDLQGYGSAYCWHSLAGEALLDLARLMTPRLIGTDFTDWSDTAQLVRREFVNFLGTQGMATFVLSALDMAVWDLVLKDKNVSMQSIRNRPERPAACYYNMHLAHDVDPDDCRRLVAAAVAKGFHAIKMWVSNRNLRRDRERVAAVRDALGPDRGLCIDANQVLTPRQAVELGDLIAEYRIEWLEDPIHKDDMAGLAWVAERSAVPIATGENAYGVDGLRRLLEAARIQTALIDFQRIGGITGFMQAEALCLSQGVRTSTHQHHPVAARLLAGCRLKEAVVEYSTWIEGPFGPAQIRDGGIVPDPGPGATCVPRSEVRWTAIDR
jgi:mandelate racemase